MRENCFITLISFLHTRIAVDADLSKLNIIVNVLFRSHSRPVLIFNLDVIIGVLFHYVLHTEF
jgi:hypothetical protein